MRTRLSILGLALGSAIALSAVAAAPARAQTVDINTPHTGSRPLQLDVHAGFTWFGFGLATGARLAIPLVENGFIDSINNAFYLNFGADFYFVRHRRNGRAEDDYDPGFGIPVTAHWEFYFNENWSAFAEVGINVYFHPGFFRGERDFFDHDHVGGWFVGAIGARLHINEWFGLVVRLGSPYSSFGVSFFI